MLSVANSEFKQSRVGRLITIHGKVRDVAKINLKTLEKVVMINEEAKKFSTNTIIKDNRMVEEYGVDEIDDIIVNTSNSKKVAQTKDIRFIFHDPWIINGPFKGGGEDTDLIGAEAPATPKKMQITMLSCIFFINESKSKTYLTDSTPLYFRPGVKVIPGNSNQVVIKVINALICFHL